jgi:mutator protein MutT
MPPTLIAVAVVERAGRYLIGRRPEGVALAGLWEFPGGKVEPSETPAEAAIRECREETGLEVTVLDEYANVVEQYAHDRVRVCFFRCRPTADENVTALTTPDGYRWVAGRELREYAFPKANEGLIAALSAANGA